MRAPQTMPQPRWLLSSALRPLAICALFCASVTPSATVAAATLSCDAVQQRLHHHPAAELHAVWRELGLAVDPSLGTSFAGVEELDVQREQGHLQGSGGQYVLLIISEGPYASGDYQYLFFLRRKHSCRYVGHLEIWDKYDAPYYRIERRPAAGAWFVVKSYGGSGTGFSRRIEAWYALDLTSVRQVLAFSSKGYENSAPDPAAVSYSFETVSTYRAAKGHEGVQIDITATYSGVGSASDSSNPQVDLFTIQRQAFVKWDSSRQRFVATPESRASFHYLEQFHGESRPDFLSSHSDELMRLAKTGTSAQKAWLRSYLEGKYGPEAEGLKSALSSRSSRRPIDHLTSVSSVGLRPRLIPDVGCPR